MTAHSTSPRPGAKLLEVLDQREMSQAELCTRMGRARKVINEIIKGKASISVESAYQLELVLGVPAAYWTDLERDFQDSQIRRRHAAALEGQLEWLEALPVEAMIGAGWLEPRATRLELAQGLLEWFGVASPRRWRALYARPRGLRRSPRGFACDPGALAAWLRAGELQAAAIDVAPYNRKTFMAALRQIRGLTREPPEVCRRRMVELSSRSGVALAWTRALPGLEVAGVSRWLSPRKALIELSLAHPTDGDLIFSFFHLAGHLLLHGRKQLFAEGLVEGKPPRDDVFEEVEADHFAANLLVPNAAMEDLRAACEQGALSHETVLDFAARQGVAPGLVVTRLQHLGWDVPEALDRLKVPLRWARPAAPAAEAGAGETPRQVASALPAMIS